MSKVFENVSIKFWLEEDLELLVVYFKKGSIITVDVARDIIKQRLIHQEGKIYKGLFFISHLGTVTPEARRFLSKEGNIGLSKVALITTSSFNAVIGNVFIEINKPNIPVKLFKTKEEGMKWLNLNKISL